MDVFRKPEYFDGAGGQQAATAATAHPTEFCAGTISPAGDSNSIFSLEASLYRAGQRLKSQVAISS